MHSLPLILVINLSRDKERWQKISAALTAAGLPFMRVRAIDARRKITLVRKLIPRSFFSATLGRALSPGECCCSLSHIAALKRIVRTQAPMAMVFEDDAEFDARLERLIREDLPKYLARCDIVKLEGIEYDYTSKRGPILARGRDSNLIIPMRPTLGSAAYGVTSKGARRLITAISTLSDPLDHMLCYYDRHGISYGEVRPFVVRQAATGSGLDKDRNVLNVAAPPSPPAGSGLVARLMRGATRFMITARVVAAARFRDSFPAK